MSLKLFTHYLVPSAKTGGVALYEKPSVNFPKGRAIEGAFSRPDVDATSGATVFDANGQLVELGEDYPDWGYDKNGGNLSLKIRPQLQNQIRNGNATGSTNGVVGSGGILPTNWNVPFGGAGLDVEIIDSGSLGAEGFVDVRFFGTASGSILQFNFESISQIAAASGETWSLSFYTQFTDVTTPPNGFRSRIQEYATSSLVNTFDGTLITTGFTNRQKLEQTATLSNGTTTHVNGNISFTLTASQPYDFTVRISRAQLEENDSVGDYVPTYGSAITRSANQFTFDDLVTKGAMSNDGFSFLFNHSDYIFGGTNSGNQFQAFSGATNVFDLWGLTDGFTPNDKINSIYMQLNPQYKNKPIVITYDGRYFKLYDSTGLKVNYDFGETNIIDKISMAPGDDTYNIKNGGLAFAPFIFSEAEALTAIEEAQNL